MALRRKKTKDVEVKRLNWDEDEQEEEDEEELEEEVEEKQPKKPKKDKVLTSLTFDEVLDIMEGNLFRMYETVKWLRMHSRR